MKEPTSSALNLVCCCAAARSGRLDRQEIPVAVLAILVLFIGAFGGMLGWEFAKDAIGTLPGYALTLARLTALSLGLVPAVAILAMSAQQLHEARFTLDEDDLHVTLDAGWRKTTESYPLRTLGGFTATPDGFEIEAEGRRIPIELTVRSAPWRMAVAMRLQKMIDAAQR